MTKKLSIITDENDRIINVNYGEKSDKKFTSVDKEKFEEVFGDIELKEDEKLMRYYDGEEFYYEIEEIEKEKIE